MRARTRRRVRRGGAACRAYPPLPPCACRCITGSLYCRLIVLPAPCIAGSLYCWLLVLPAPHLAVPLLPAPLLPFLCCPFCCCPFLCCLFLCPCCMLCGPPPGSPLCRLCRCKLCLCGMPCGLRPGSPAVHPLCPLSCPPPPPPLLPGHVAVGCCRPVGCLCMCAGIFLSLTPGNPVNPVSRPSCCSILSSWRVFSAALRSGPTRLTNEADLRSLTKLAWAADLGS
ncbi:hypothetical protein JaAD80_15710 [Janthinobacterium sp. AD80]|nr:hypothetical protein JaAD80_15710 [Janthinobacterium sp. AD80]